MQINDTVSEMWPWFWLVTISAWQHHTNSYNALSKIRFIANNYMKALHYKIDLILVHTGIASKILHFWKSYFFHRRFYCSIAKVKLLNDGHSVKKKNNLILKKSVSQYCYMVTKHIYHQNYALNILSCSVGGPCDHHT